MCKYSHLKLTVLEQYLLKMTYTVLSLPRKMLWSMAYADLRIPIRMLCIKSEQSIFSLKINYEN